MALPPEDTDRYTTRARVVQREARIRLSLLLTSLSLAALAIWWLPSRAPRLPRVVTDRDPGPPAPPVARGDTIRRGDGVVGALVRMGLGRTEAAAVLRASQTRATARRTIPVTLRYDSAGAPIREVELQIADDRSLRVIRGPGDAWETIERREVWRSDTLVIRAAIRRDLVSTVREATRPLLQLRSRSEVAYALADAYEYKLDVGRELQPGDSVVAIIERQRTAFGAERVGALIAGAIRHEGQWIEAVRFVTREGRQEYFDGRGQPLRSTFLSTPVQYRRISSGFGGRQHPILGVWKRHEGIDYSAAYGTPVRSVGDGTVLRAGRSGGFGNLVEIQHRTGLVTRYAHLAGFGSGVRAGAPVAQGQVIGFVGSTGLSTAPHLHFETIVNGVSRDPSRTLREASGAPLAGLALREFALWRSTLMPRLATGPTDTAATARVPAPTATPATAPAAGGTR